MTNGSQIGPILDRIKAFNEARDWAQFHNPKDLAISLSLEASEVLEHFLWKNPAEMAEHLRVHKTAVSDELADVFYNVLLMCQYFDIDLIAATHAKIDKNEAKYPPHKARGNHAKYTEYKNAATD